jgi:hypothetical protein
MKANDSRECRNCHEFQAMDFTRQSKRAADAHSAFLAKGEKTCIDCHKASPTACRTWRTNEDHPQRRADPGHPGRKAAQARGAAHLALLHRVHAPILAC